TSDRGAAGGFLAHALPIAHGGRVFGWEVLGMPPTSAVSGISDPSMERFVGPVAYVSVSSDGGRTWSRPRHGPEVTPEGGGAFVIPLTDRSGRVLLVDSHRLWSSDDEGLTWTSRLMHITG